MLLAILQCPLYDISTTIRHNTRLVISIADTFNAFC